MYPSPRILYWEGSARNDFKRFPLPVQKDMGVALFAVQLGGTPSSAKRWKGLGPAIYQLAERYRGDAFRVVYLLLKDDSVHVLHAFRKKSKSGVSTPPRDVALVEMRFKAVLARHRKGGG